MQRRSLAFTRRGVRLFHWGVETAALSVLLLVASSWMAAAGGVASAVFRASSVAMLAAPLLLAAGTFLLAAAPPEAGVGRHAVAMLAFVAASHAWRVLVYAADLPAAFLAGPLGLVPRLVPLLLGVWFTVLLAALCRWVATVERSDVEADDPDRVVAADTRDVVVWEGLAGRAGRLMWWGLAFLAAVILAGSTGSFADAGPVRIGAAVVLVAWGVLLLVRFSRLLWAVVGALRRDTAPREGADAAWSRVPPDRFPAVAIVVAVVAVASVVVDAWAERTLAPRWRERQAVPAGAGAVVD